MADYVSHKPGTFSWAELSTTDQREGVAFYRSLLGWDSNEQPMGPGESYTIFRLGGRDVAAAYTMRPDERAEGVPPHWNLYVTVTSVDQSATMAAQLGGTIVAPPFDVMDVGRMAVVQDPTGATFCLWQAKTHIGARALKEPGALCWSELTTRDPQAAETFYTRLFGWTAHRGAASGGPEYTEFHNQGDWGVGMMAMPPEMPPFVPSFWMPYFQVTELDERLTKATSLGAAVKVGIMTVPKTGRLAILEDPQGAAFALFEFTSDNR